MLMLQQVLVVLLLLLPVALAQREQLRRIPGSQVELPLSDAFQPIAGIRGVAHPDAAAMVRAWHVGPTPKEQSDGNDTFREGVGFQKRYAPQRGRDTSTSWTRTA